MRKVTLYSVLLVLGLAGSQYLPTLGPERAHDLAEVVELLAMVALSFIMIHVGYEFDLDHSRLGQYAVDFGVAATAAAFPWIFCSVYFVLLLAPPGASGRETWASALLAGIFAAPTSAGILFSMLAAAGLSATWVFRKARILAIFDDLDTVLLMVPLKMLIVGMRWQLGATVLVMGTLLWAAWRWLHRLDLPVTWPWVMSYGVALTLTTELVHHASLTIDEGVPIHIEVLLPAFVLGCVLARPPGHDPHRDDAREGHQEGPESAAEQRVAGWVSGAFMVLVGLSMPPIESGDAHPGAAGAWPGWATIALHTLAVTALANLGKMVPLFCYRRDAHRRERLALCIGMWPRGEVGAGVLVVAIGYGIAGTMVTVASLSLALNLLATGVFIYVAKRLLAVEGGMPSEARRARERAGRRSQPERR